MNAIGRMDAVIHNAGAYTMSGRSRHPRDIRPSSPSTRSPYILTALIERPRRLVYLGSGIIAAAAASLRDIDRRERRWNSSQA